MKKALILFLTLIMLLEGCACFAETAAEPQAAVGYEAGAEEAEIAEEAADEADEAVEEAAEEAEEAAEATDEAAEEAEEEKLPPVEYNYDELTVGSTTPFDGKFFTQLWGNDSSDLDVRMLIHGYDTIEWSVEQSQFGVDPSVVSGIAVAENAAGDRTYTLTLYDDLYYSDGTKITAWDYAFSVLLSIDPKLAELGANPRPMDYLAGYNEYVSGQASYLSGLHVQDDNTLVFLVLSDHLPYFYELTMLDCVPYPIHVIAPGCEVRDDGQGVYIANADDSVEEPVFTTELLRQTIMDEATGYMSHPSVVSGPYKLTSFDGTTAEFEINEYYKGNANGLKPVIPKLIYRTADSATMMEELGRGEYGLLNRCVSTDAVQKGLELITGGDTFTMSNYMRSGYSFINFCTEKRPMDSLAVRQAISMCMDKDGFVRDTLGNNGVRVDGYYGMGQWMSLLVDGNQSYPVEEPAPDAPDSEQEAYNEKIAEWEAVNLDNVRVYPLDTEAAQALLAEDGWTLNREGAEFRPGEDDVRCKDFDGELVALELKLLCPENSSMDDSIDANFAANLAQAGILLDVQVLPMQELLQNYYRGTERDCDMIMLATNFDVVFEPSIYFMPDTDEQINPYNTAALRDSALYDLLTDLRSTPSDDLLGYCKKWVAFQEKFQETVPMLPIYSNVYFDFYPRVLQDYDISSNVAWSTAIVGAYLGDVEEEEEEEEAIGMQAPEEDFELEG